MGSAIEFAAVFSTFWDSDGVANPRVFIPTQYDTQRQPLVLLKPKCSRLLSMFSKSNKTPPAPVASHESLKLMVPALASDELALGMTVQG